MSLRQLHQLLARPVQKLRIGGECHVLGLNRGVDDHPRQFGRLDCLGLGGNRPALLDQRLPCPAVGGVERRCDERDVVRQEKFHDCGVFIGLPATTDSCDASEGDPEGSPFAFTDVFY